MPSRPAFFRLGAPCLVLALCAVSLVAGAATADLPRRKPGLWEITTRIEGVPSVGPMQQCVGPNTDLQMLQNARKKNCRVLELTPRGNRLSVHSVCTMDGSTATSDGLFEGVADGAVNTRYSGTLDMRFDPPWRGMKETRVTHAGRWLGPCKPGQKPGETSLPNVGGIDLDAIMKDPQLQKLLKGLQRP